ncbi:MAG TPA: NADH-quinone oxidoreductase subunit C [Candidatus Bathyarchaeia archaeon]|nr:NADH-quinone oxidoreductase subunit C [Candidatus Bathyarchaeia archaeon]
METENEVVEKLRQCLKDAILEVSAPRKRRIFLHVKTSSLVDTIKYLVNDLEFKHISTITGSDLGQEMELMYHLAHEGSVELSVRVKVPKNNPSVPSITNIIPGAVLYEREVHDVLGVTFEGHPDLSRLILPEEWPEGVYPLRKDEKFEELRKIGSK